MRAPEDTVKCPQWLILLLVLCRAKGRQKTYTWHICPGFVLALRSRAISVLSAQHQPEDYAVKNWTDSQFDSNAVDLLFYRRRNKFENGAKEKEKKELTIKSAATIIRYAVPLRVTL